MTETPQISSAVSTSSSNSPIAIAVASAASRSPLADRVRSISFLLTWFRRPAYNVAEAVIRLRRFRGISQEELAEKMGTKQPAIARLEAGRANMRLSTLTQLAEALDATIRIDLAPAECLAHTMRQRPWWDEPSTWMLLEPIPGEGGTDWTAVASQHFCTEGGRPIRVPLPSETSAPDVFLQLEVPRSQAVFGELVG
jgi:transcriptional regulator with XRE-family HTH domain